MNGDGAGNYLGQRAAFAFVATPLLRDACAAHFGSHRLGYYADEVGVFAAMAGDLTSAQEYFSIGVSVHRDAGDAVNLAEHLTAAATCLRDGDYLIELAVTLADLAECARAQGEPETAERYAAEAVTIASPRGMTPAHSGALAARARIRAGQAAITADPDLLYQGRDAADAALRLAVRHHLAWHELDAMRAHADLDQAEGTDHGWAARAGALHARLVPPGLDPDPLATVERVVAAGRPPARRGRRGGRRRTKH